ncbi:succinylglutamate desuccinylase/aspartoacylase family protein [Tianweitania populi]|uniref:succinylglutamate desuccinylase/aspartoacylase domain-containing protein n=1 Tax=Tianweitania populi TaxID=1607949 RepID=UPI0024566459|nr:succinylglutamate desuccinylase/aspartoacylase family protein [Tianweitania populi]
MALARLGREIDPKDVSGRIIILPSLNLPAVAAGRRVSPLDDGNMNRSFPGDPKGGSTAMIAHYVSSVLLRLADVVVDLHAGGRSSYYLPCALIREGGDETEKEVNSPDGSARRSRRSATARVAVGRPVCDGTEPWPAGSHGRTWRTRDSVKRGNGDR